ncbi:hypothetical protein FKW77_007374 [Venturia effusa]|uniref:Uncharacterized protein n=1 Tax=Venturia effusa TaxID=50376 RepID=A0A517LN61_9PEZI|nr:hypothetical protein FKW77_007374 [Venturia effusa]
MAATPLLSRPTHTAAAAPPKVPQYPLHNAPRVWFMTDGLSPIAIALSRYLLEHGDYIVAGMLPHEFETARGEGLRNFMSEVVREGRHEEDIGHEDGLEDNENGIDDDAGLEDMELGGDKEWEEVEAQQSKRRKRWRDRFRVVRLDGRNIAETQSAVAEALAAFGRIDILFICKSEALVGSVEELSQTSRTQTLVRDQFETNFFGPVNVVKAVLPSMREKRNGHIVAMTGITAHLGTPGFAMYCSSQWALEGYCDSLAFEVAPFNIKMTIIQPNLEINVLTNRIISAPPMPEYAQDINPAPMARDLMSGILDRFDGFGPTAQSPTHDPSLPQDSPSSLPSPCTHHTASVQGDDKPSHGDAFHTTTLSSLYPTLPVVVQNNLIIETVFAIAAIGGHDNPPARHIVGFEGVESVKEKLKTVSEELEDFLDVSGAVDIGCEGSQDGVIAGL